MLRDSVVVVRTRPRAIPLAMITIRKILHGFPFLSHDAYGAPLGGPSGRRSSAMIASLSFASTGKCNSMFKSVGSLLRMEAFLPKT